MDWCSLPAVQRQHQSCLQGAAQTEVALLHQQLAEVKQQVVQQAAEFQAQLRGELLHRGQADATLMEFVRAQTASQAQAQVSPDKTIRRHPMELVRVQTASQAQACKRGAPASVACLMWLHGRPDHRQTQA